MRTLNHTLNKHILEADGCYLGAQELYLLEQYVQSYAARLDTYQKLHEHGEKLVLLALRKLAQDYPDVIRQHGARCKYDMTEVLRYIALSVLRDDESFFKEHMMVWLDTILLAYKRNSHCGVAYRHLQDAIAANFSAPDANLIRPYLDLIIYSLQSHV